MKSRPYQEEAIQSVFDYFAHNPQGNPLIAMPTGTGKSVVLGGFIKRAIQQYPRTRVMMLTHVKELIDQNHRTLKKIWPNAPVGIYSSGLNKRDTKHPILFGGVKSVVNQPAEIFGRIDLLLVDECHLISPKAATNYAIIIEALTRINPRLRIIGLTATPYRLGMGSLLEEGGVFTDVCYDLTSMQNFNMLIDEGYLSTLIPFQPALKYDLSNVRIVGNDYNKHDLEEAVNNNDLNRLAVKELIASSAGRKHWLIFASGIHHTEAVAEVLRAEGVPTTFVHSKLSTKERDKNVRDYLAGHYTACVNMGTMTTGFDFPGIDLIGGMRPTVSANLHVQMLGRGTRPVYAPGYDLAYREHRLAAIAAGPKKNCLVMDFARNTERLGPINDPIIPKKKKRKALGGAGFTSAVKVCPSCGAYNALRAISCVNCSLEFPLVVRLEAEASTLALIATEASIKVERYAVENVMYLVHLKEGSEHASVKVNYFCGLRMFTEWLYPEHISGLQNKARAWWRKRADTVFPESAAEFVRRGMELRVPHTIKVKEGLKYPEVVDSYFN